MSKLLLPDSHPLLVLPELADAIGLNEAIVLQQVHYWIENNKKERRNFHRGRCWVYNSYRKWNENFPFWSERTIKKIFLDLEKQGLLISGNFNKLKIDRTKWYTIDYDAFEKLCSDAGLGKSCTIDSADIAQALPETNTKTQNDNNGHNGLVSNQPARACITHVEHSDPDISYFIDWYFELYEYYKHRPHPPIKSKQKIRVHDTLKEFCNENDVDIEGLESMAEAFFNVPSSDHNINHFATDGILQNRFYEVLY